MPEETYTFKKAGLKDFNAFWRAFAENIKTQFPEYSAKTRNFFIEQEYCLKAVKAQLKNKQIAIYAAFFEKSVVGFLMVRYLCGGVGMANWLAVSKKHQGKGIATKLLQMWQNEAKKSGMHKIQLWTDKRNLNFYKKQGVCLCW
ncbi:MAG: GNAT family N-acetyltransferase [Candidatus Pacebacteria bacterium]|nr:GNAT family N-acetyltransferase [Candidatus Paceibacterota bacterium]